MVNYRQNKNMKKRLSISALVILYLTLGLAYPEIIKFKNGKTIEAPIIEKTSEYIRIDFQGIPIKYYFDEIENIYTEQLLQPQVEPRKDTEDQGRRPVSIKKKTAGNKTLTEESKLSSEKPLELSPEIIEIQKEIIGFYQEGAAEELYKKMGDSQLLQETLEKTLTLDPSQLSYDSKQAQEYLDQLKKLLPEIEKYKDLNKK